MNLHSGGPAGRAVDQSDTPEGRAHKTVWQHRTPTIEETAVKSWSMEKAIETYRHRMHHSNNETPESNSYQHLNLNDQMKKQLVTDNINLFRRSEQPFFQFSVHPKSKPG